MNYDFSPADQAFRAEVRDWLRSNVPADPRPLGGSSMREFDLAWQGRQYDGGWAGIAWPTQYGGRGMTLTQQLVWHEEYVLAGAPDVGANFVGLNHGGPTLIARASESQKTEHLPRILRGEVVWCQGFSEPNAGSDLANIQTRGMIDGDELVVTGQKIWTSYASVADFQELLVRTERGSARHQGITWVIADMRAPGVDVRPIRTATRDSHFAEVFYDEVRIPLSNVVGRLHDGWRVAMSTLGFERGTAFMSRQVSLHRQTESLVALAREHVGPDGVRPAIEDDEIARALGDLRAEVAALRAMTIAVVSKNDKVAEPGPDGSMIKLYFSSVTQHFTKLSMDILGSDALQFIPMDESDGWTGRYMRSLSASIGGGTSEIQRNIIGERVLGLPR